MARFDALVTFEYMSRELVVGRSTRSDVANFEGFLDDLRIYDEALTTPQIQTLASGND